MDDNIIERRGRKYQYSEIDDSWYPLPTEEEYDFQRFVLFIGSILLVCYIAYLFVEKYLGT